MSRVSKRSLSCGVLQMPRTSSRTISCGSRRPFVELVDEEQLTRVQLKQLFDYLSLMSLVAPLVSRGFNAIASGNDKVFDEVCRDLDALKKSKRG